MIRNYIKKPIPIRAIQWHGTPTSTIEVLAFGCGKILYGIMSDNPENEGLIIQTLEGNMKPEVGDYIVKGNHDDIWSVKKDIFEATYEEVNE